MPPCPGGSIERRPKKNEKKSLIVTGQETQFGPINDVDGAPNTANVAKTEASDCSVGRETTYRDPRSAELPLQRRVAIPVVVIHLGDL